MKTEDIKAFLAAAGIAAVCSLASCGNANAQESVQASVSFAEEKVALETISETVESSGNLEPLKADDLSFAAAGMVIELNVSEGQKAEAGKILARIEDTDQRYALADARSNLEDARISGTSSEIALLELKVRSLEAALAKTVIRAPYDCIVSSIGIRKGLYASAGIVAFRVIDRSSLLAILEVDEIDLPFITVGQKVVFEIDALEGALYEGVISRIPLEGTVTSEGLVVFDIESLITSPPPELFPGFSFVATITVSGPKEALTLSSKAVSVRDGNYFVLVKGPDGKPVPKKIEALKLRSGKWEIVSGLAAGDAVLVRGFADSSGQTGGAQGSMPFMIPGMTGPPPGGGSRTGTPSQGSRP